MSRDMLPNFLIIGAMKAGTTSLYHHLKDHPDVYMPSNKEPGFFSDEHVWSRGIEWYKALFAGGEGAKAIGEASTNYAKFPYFSQVPGRIAHYLPHVKLLYILRSPIERMCSHYVHNYYAGREKDPIEKALLTKPNYRHVSCYHLQLEQYWKYFPADQIKVLTLDELQSDPRACVRGVFDFIEVDSSYIPRTINQVRHVTEQKIGRDNVLMRLLKTSPVYNDISCRLPVGAKSALNVLLRSKVTPPEELSSTVRMKLVDELREDVGKLSKYLNRDLSHWLE